MSTFTLVYTRAFTIPFYSDKVNIPYPNLVKQGNATSVATNKLIDSTADFSGIQVGDTVMSPSAAMMAIVVGVENNTTLLLSEDMFFSIGDGYEIYQGQNNGCYIYIPDGVYASGGGLIEVETIGGDIVAFFNPPAGVLPVQVLKVRTGTDIGKIIALW